MTALKPGLWRRHYTVRMSDPSSVAHRGQRLIGHLAASGKERNIDSIRSKLAPGSYYITFMSVQNRVRA
jgi:hypothetical protein